MDPASSPKNPASIAILAEAKEQLRQELRARRGLLPQAVLADLSLAVATRLAAWLKTRQASQVLFFYPVQGEVDLRSLLELLPNVNLALPVLPARGKGMSFARWTRSTPMVVNRYGIPEPRTDQGGVFVEVDTGTVILVPCLGLDAEGTRLGYGGGFYDRYLALHAAELVTVGVVLKEFMSQGLPIEDHDVPLQFCATEAGVASLPGGKES